MASLVKKCKPYLARASELDVHNPVVAYYCRLYVLDILFKGRAAGENNPESDALLFEVLDGAEKAKSSGMDLAKGQDLTEEFALSVFSAADEADRAGGAAGQGAAGIASQLYLSSLFLEVLAQFYDGELPPDYAEKARYAKFRAVQIRDCIKTGKEIPAPGLPLTGEQDPDAAQNLSFASAVPPAQAPAPQPSAAAAVPPHPQMPQASAAPPWPAESAAAASTSFAAPGAQAPDQQFGGAAAAAMPPHPQMPQVPPHPQMPQQQFPPPQASAAAAAAPSPLPPASAPMPVAPPAPMPTAPAACKPVPASVGIGNKTEAKRKVEFALSAIDFDDISGAMNFLRQALAELERIPGAS